MFKKAWWEFSAILPGTNCVVFLIFLLPLPLLLLLLFFFFLHCYRYSGHSTTVFSVLYMTERLISDFTSLYFLSVKVDLFCSFPAADFYSSARAALHVSRILIFHLTLDPDASLNFIICLKQPIITPLSLTQPLIGSLYIHLLCMYKIYL